MGFWPNFLQKLESMLCFSVANFDAQTLIKCAHVCKQIAWFHTAKRFGISSFFFIFYFGSDFLWNRLSVEFGQSYFGHNTIHRGNWVGQTIKGERRQPAIRHLKAKQLYACRNSGKGLERGNSRLVSRGGHLRGRSLSVLCGRWEGFVLPKKKVCCNCLLKDESLRAQKSKTKDENVETQPWN